MKGIGFVALTLLAFSPFARADDKEDEKQATLKAKLQCTGILQACEAYTVNPQNKMEAPPKMLLELVKPPFGGPSFLRNGEKDLIDPWGKMIQYAVAKDEKGNLRAYIWTERTVDGKLTVIGMRPPQS